MGGTAWRFAKGTEVVGLLTAAQRSFPFHWWCGASGSSIIFSVYRGRDLSFVREHDGPSIYCIAADTGARVAKPLYFGKATSTRDRLRQHLDSGLIASADMLGATEIHLHLLARSDEQRTRIEADLIKGNPTALNVQHNVLGGLFGLGIMPATHQQTGAPGIMRPAYAL